jgi:hypothetical protein
MADNIKVIKQDNNVKVTENINKVTISSVGVQGPKGTEIHQGIGGPTNSIGVIGDYYIDTATKEFYGPKTASGWGSPDFIMGGNALTVGSGNPSNTFGSNGDVFINTTTNTVFTKVGGVWGSGQVLVNPFNFSYVHEQQSPNTIWSINHNLHYRPSITVVDYGKNNIECDISHTDADNSLLAFNVPVSGYAYLS